MYYIRKLRLTPQLLFYTVHDPSFCAVSSAVEHYTDTVGVTGSNPVSRTTFQASCYGLLRGFAIAITAGFLPLQECVLMPYGSL